jgi:serine/threonine protein kinase
MKKYEILEPLSHAAGCKTFRAKRLKDGATVVAKKISYVGLPMAQKKIMVDKSNLLIQLSRYCTGLVKYHTAVVDSENGTLVLIMDYHPNGSVQKIIQQASHEPLSTDKIWSIITDVGLALYECHNAKPEPLTHGALCPEHVFIDNDGSAVIGCFSLDSHFSVDKEKDIADLGALLFQLATLQPFTSKRQVSLTKLKDIDEGMRTLIINMLNPTHSVEHFTLLNFLEFPEVALRVLEKKLKIEREIYEQEKRACTALEEDLLKREKRINAEGISVATEKQ